MSLLNLNSFVEAIENNYNEQSTSLNESHNTLYKFKEGNQIRESLNESIEIKEGKDKLIWSSTAVSDYIYSLDDDGIKKLAEEEFDIDTTEDEDEDEYDIESLRDDLLDRVADDDYDDLVYNILPMLFKAAPNGIMLFGSDRRWDGSREAFAIMEDEDDFVSFIYPGFDQHSQLVSSDGQLALSTSDHDGGSYTYLYSLGDENQADELLSNIFTDDEFYQFDPSDMDWEEVKILMKNEWFKPITSKTFGLSEAVEDNQLSECDVHDIELKESLSEKDRCVKEWYLEAYPTDGLGEDIDDTVTFDNILSGMREGKDIYDLLEVGDSVIRERVFEKLAEIFSVDYDDVYYLWRDHTDTRSKLVVTNKVKASLKEWYVSDEKFEGPGSYEVEVFDAFFNEDDDVDYSDCYVYDVVEAENAKELQDRLNEIEGHEVGNSVININSVKKVNNLDESCEKNLNEFEELSDEEIEAIEDRIEELKREIEYEEEKLAVSGYGSSDLRYLDSLNSELHELESKIYVLDESNNEETSLERIPNSNKTKRINEEVEKPYFRAFITNLGKYNEGELIGEWVDFPIDSDDFEVVLNRIGISDKPDKDGNYYEEWFVTDYECNLNGFNDFGEYPSYRTLNDFGELLNSIKDVEAVDNVYQVTGNLEESIEGLNNGEIYYYPELDDEYDLGEYIVEELYGGVENLKKDTIEDFFDYEKLGRELGFDDYWDMLDSEQQQELLSQGHEDSYTAAEFICGDEDASDERIGETYMEQVGGVQGIKNPENYFDYRQFGQYLVNNGNFTFTHDGCVETL